MVIKEIFVSLHSKCPRMGIMRKNMKIRQSKELSLLAKLTNKSENEIGEKIISELLKNGMIYDEPLNWGCQIIECIDCDVPISEIVKIINIIGIENVKSEHFDALMNLTLIGHGDCPICGGDMEIVDGEYRCCAGDGYLTPFEYEPIWEEKQCMNCGYQNF